MNQLSSKKIFLLDMDGTIFLGNQLIDGAEAFLEKLRAKGKRYVFLTNNSSKNKEAYVEKLNRLGLSVEAEEIFTSGEATTIYINEIMPGARVFLLGTKALEEEFVRAGFQLVKEKNQEVDFVVLGFDTSLTYDKLWVACDYLVQGVPYIATHPDVNCPLPQGRFMPDAGAMAALIEASTGRRPKVIGKPSKEIIRSVTNKYGLDLADVVMVGDRLYTDIKMGEVAGITTALVYSGETKPEDYKKSSIQSDFQFNSVKDMMGYL